MYIPVHQIHVFDKPKKGNQLIRAYAAGRYKHKISVLGGCDTASCNIMVSRAEAEYVYEQMVGNRVAIYVDNPAAPIWEGLINRITINLPGLVMTRGLDEMGNRINASYRTVNQTEVPIVGAAVNNTVSQALYGIKEKTIRLAQHTGAGGLTYPTALQNTALALTAYPLASAAPANASPTTIVEIEMIGFYRTLEWEKCNNVMPAGGAFFMQAITPLTFSFISMNLNAMANAATFFNNADYTGISDNLTIYTTAASLSDSMWRQFQMVAECGISGGTRWIIGVTQSDWYTGARKLYYRAADTTTKYTVRVGDGGRIRTTAGALVRPWTVQPDGVLKLLDALVGWDGAGADPRNVYLVDITYDADSQRVTWESDDSIEMQGALQVRKVHTSTDMSYGQRAGMPMV